MRRKKGRMKGGRERRKGGRRKGQREEGRERCPGSSGVVL